MQTFTKILLKTLTCLGLLLLLTTVELAKEKMDLTKSIINGPSGLSGVSDQDPVLDPLRGPEDCEVATLYVDRAFAQNRLVPDGQLIVIARLGDGETSRDLNASRAAEL